MSGNQSSHTLLYGLPVARRYYDFKSGSTWPLLNTTTTTYKALTTSPYLSNNLLTIPGSVVASGSNTATTSYGYDETSLSSSGVSTQHDTSPPDGSVRGNQTSVSRFLNGTSVQTTNCPVTESNGNATTKVAFFDTGEVAQTTDPCLHVVSNTYSTTYDGAYLTQTAAGGLTTSYTYDFNTGLVASSIDPNNQPTYYTYDNMWRKTKITLPDGGESDYFYPDAVTIEVTHKIDGTRSTDYFAHFDGIGREIRHISANDEATPWDQVDTCYDSVGRVSFKSYPYQGSGLSAAAVCSGAGDAFSYDPLSRTTAVTHSDGSSVTTSYTGAATSVSDEGNGTRAVQRVSQVDGLGRLLSLCEVSNTTLIGTTPAPGSCAQAIAATGFLTSYTYDNLGNLRTVAQGGLNSRSFQYDSLSHLTSATNPESGTITYAYDADGMVITKTAPASSQSTGTLTTTIAYDSLHRLTSKSYSDSTPGMVNIYDTPQSGSVNTNGRVRLTYTRGSSPFSEASNTAFSYDSVGRITDEWQCAVNCPSHTGSIVWHLTAGYDLAGDMTSYTDGMGDTFSVTPNRALRPTELTSSLSDTTGHPGTLFNQGTYNAAESLLTATLGNTINEVRTYDSRLRLSTITAGTVYSLSIPATGGYAPNGDILQANDSVNGSWTYGYDDFNRLKSASATGQSYTYDYDRFGNRWHQNGPHTMMISFTGNNNRMDGYSYSASGNVLNDGTTTYTYDAENRILTATNSISGTSTYVYDANGRRIQKTTSAGTVNFIYDMAGHEMVEVNASGGWSREEIYLGGQHLATYSGGPTGTTIFNHADWLGTERARSDYQGSLYETCTSLPFGDALTCTNSDSSPMHLTGQERDNESGLDNFGARYGSSALGRFTSPDETLIDQFAISPQSWNLYAYVRDDPTDAVDPSGQDCIYINDNKATVKRGDCVSDSDSGIFVNGTIDTKSGSYDPSTGVLSFSYMNDDTGALGRGFVTNVHPSGGVSDVDRLKALALAGRIAEPGVNLAATGLKLFGYIVAAPAMIAAECFAGAPCSKGNVAMAILPEVGALREGALLVKEGAAVGKAAEILQKGGGMAQAAKDFESLQGAEKVLGSTRVKELADGTKAVLYESKGGSASIALQDAAGRTLTKIRY